MGGISGRHARGRAAARSGARGHLQDGGGVAMPICLVGVCSHAPGITGRAERADPRPRETFHAALQRLRAAIEASRAQALIVIAAEHFANFFMNNMPAFAIGMADHYEGPIEDPRSEE